jgi:very-short-patch-repair endonuclease
MEPDSWSRAAETARSQFGVVTHSQLLQAGFSRSWITRAATAGRLVRMHEGVYGLGQLPTDPRARPFAATLVGGHGACIADRSAAKLLGLDRWEPAAVSVISPRRRQRSRSGVLIRQKELEPREFGTFDGVPCTSPSRTLLDLAALSSGLARHAVVSAGGNGLLDLDEILVLLELRRGHRGAGRLRSLIAGEVRVPSFTRSELERRVHRLCRTADLASPDMNVEVAAVDGRLFECDCVWPRRRLIIECDSRWHDNPVSALSDAERDELLTLTGWRVHRIRWAQVVRHPHRAAALIRRLLAEQEKLLGAACRAPSDR